MNETATHLNGRVGETVALRLERQGVGGFVWDLGPLPPGLSLGDDQVRESGPGVGGGSQLVVNLQILAPGIHSFVCELHRPWGAREACERRTVQISAA